LSAVLGKCGTEQGPRHDNSAGQPALLWPLLWAVGARSSLCFVVSCVGAGWERERGDTADRSQTSAGPGTFATRTRRRSGGRDTRSRWHWPW